MESRASLTTVHTPHVGQVFYLEVLECHVEAFAIGAGPQAVHACDAFGQPQLAVRVACAFAVLFTSSAMAAIVPDFGRPKERQGRQGSEQRPQRTYEAAVETRTKQVEQQKRRQDHRQQSGSRVVPGRGRQEPVAVVRPGEDDHVHRTMQQRNRVE